MRFIRIFFNRALGHYIGSIARVTEILIFVLRQRDKRREKTKQTNAGIGIEGR